MRLRSRIVPAAIALIVLVTTASCGQAPAPAPAEPSAPANPLHGVWSMTAMISGGGEAKIDPSQPGLFIFTKGHYSAVYSLGEDPRPLSVAGFDPTSEEKVAHHREFWVRPTEGFSSQLGRRRSAVRACHRPPVFSSYPQ